MPHDKDWLLTRLDCTVWYQTITVTIKERSRSGLFC